MKMIPLTKLSKKLKMSPQAINYRLNKIGKRYKNKHTKLIRNRLWVDSTAVKRIDYHKTNSTSKFMKTRKGVPNPRLTKPQLIKILKGQEKIMTSQQQTITSQQRTIRNLSRRLPKFKNNQLTGPKMSFMSRLKLFFNPKK